MAFNLKEAVRFSITPESPEPIARHIWFPKPYDVRVTNPRIMAAIEGHGLQLGRFFEIDKTVKGERARIAGERAGAVLFSATENTDQPLVMFQRGPLSTDVSNFVVVPSGFNRLPTDVVTTYDDMLTRVIADTAFNYVHGMQEPINNQLTSK